MTFDGIITYSVIQELNNLIIGGRIERINIPNNSQIYMHIYAHSKYALLIDLNASNARIHLTSKTKTSQPVPPTFCMVLRKHLESSRILAIKQYKLDRIIQIDFETYTEMKDKTTKTLMIELMGKYSNCMLLDSNGKIIDGFHRVDETVSSKRLVLPGLPYEYPDTKLSFIETSKEDFISFYDNTSAISDYILGKYNGFSKYGISSLNIENDSIENAYIKIHNLFDSIKDNKLGVINENEKDMYISPTDKQDLSFSISKIVDDSYTHKQNILDLQSAKQNLIKSVNPILNKDKKNLKIFTKNLEECLKMDTYRMYGELLSANLYKLKDKTNEITLENFYDNNSPITIPLDNTITPQKNAEKFFKKYNKLKTTLSYSTNQKEILENEIDYLESAIYSIENCENLNDLQNIKLELIDQKYLKNKVDKKGRVIKEDFVDSKTNYDKYEYNGYTIIVGKNNVQNEYITHKLAHDTDLWLHAQKIHGSHVIIQNGKDAPINVIEYASSIAGYYSKSKLDSKVNIDYCLAKYVKRHPSKKPGMVIYTDYSTITIEPLKKDK